jgi:hypothetical protein
MTNGTFFPALSSISIAQLSLWIRFGKALGRSQTDLKRKKGHEKQAFLEFAWRGSAD